MVSINEYIIAIGGGVCVVATLWASNELHRQSDRNKRPSVHHTGKLTAQSRQGHLNHRGLSVNSITRQEHDAASKRHQKSSIQTQRVRVISARTAPIFPSYLNLSSSCTVNVPPHPMLPPKTLLQQQGTPQANTSPSAKPSDHASQHAPPAASNSS
jgi:hypothetical protein